MRARTPRALLGLVVLLASLSAWIVTGAAARAAPGSSCSSSTGVLVVVDLRHFGGSLTRGCDPSPTTGYAALHEAGYTTEGTHHDGNAFVCRIDGYPTPKQDPCFNTPPANAYWSYWHADAGQSRWTYSTLGAQSYQPENGSIDAWVFGSTSVSGSSGGPSFTPAEARGQTSGGSGSGGTGSGGGSGSGSSGGSGGSGSGSGGSDQAGTGHGAATGAGGSGRPAPARAAASSAASGSAAASTSASASTPATRNSTSTAAASGAAATSQAQAAAGPSFADASSVAHKSTSSTGSPWPVILVVALVLLLGAGGGWGVVRRRRADAAEH